MPLQNRVDPWGQLHSHPSRKGALMGNRGILHSAERTVIRRWATTAWVCCTLHDERLPPRRIFQVEPRLSYSELFFLDEAVAFAAGHRPCNYCRGVRLAEFKKAWWAANRSTQEPKLILISEIDKQIHMERQAPKGLKPTVRAKPSTLPDGTMVANQDRAFLLWRGNALPWSFDGYGKAAAEFPEEVDVLTPSSVVGAFRLGYRPAVHKSADA